MVAHRIEVSQHCATHRHVGSWRVLVRRPRIAVDGVAAERLLPRQGRQGVEGCEDAGRWARAVDEADCELRGGLRSAGKVHTCTAHSTASGMRHSALSRGGLPYRGGIRGKERRTVSTHACMHMAPHRTGARPCWRVGCHRLCEREHTRAQAKVAAYSQSK